MKKSTQHYLEYTLVLFLEKLTLTMSLKSRHKLAAYLSSLFYHLIPIRKQVVKKNLKNSFPEKSENWYDRTTKQTYFHFLRTYLDLFPGHKDPPEKFKKYVNMHNQEKLDKIIEENKGAIIVLFHFGNWEIPGAWISRNNYYAACLYREQSNSYVDQKLLEARTWNDGILLPMDTSPLKLMKIIKNKGLLLMISDQDARDSGIFVNFFNQPSSSYRGPALFALRRQVPLIAMTSIWNGEEYEIRLKTIDTTGMEPSKANIQKIMQKYTNYFEEKIKKYPEQYYWLHRRWKTKPNNHKKNQSYYNG